MLEREIPTVYSTRMSGLKQKLHCPAGAGTEEFMEMPPGALVESIIFILRDDPGIDDDDATTPPSKGSRAQGTSVDNHPP